MLTSYAHVAYAKECPKTGKETCECGDEKASEKQKEIQMPSGLSYTDLKVGEGDMPQKGQTVIVLYKGWLWENGKVFDSALDRKSPVHFPIGVGKVIPGWDEGVMTMRVGGKRRLVIPADLAYGVKGVPGTIPPHAKLVFEVELLGVE